MLKVHSVCACTYHDTYHMHMHIHAHSVTHTHTHTQMHEEFCIEIRRDSHPRDSSPWSLKTLSSNHSVTRVYTIDNAWVSITCDGNPFSANHIYMSGRVVRAQGLQRPGVAHTWVRIPPHLNAKFTMHTHIATCTVHTHMNIHTHTQTHTCTHARTRTCICTRTQAILHTCTSPTHAHARSFCQGLNRCHQPQSFHSRYVSAISCPVINIFSHSRSLYDIYQVHLYMKWLTMHGYSHIDTHKRDFSFMDECRPC